MSANERITKYDDFSAAVYDRAGWPSPTEEIIEQSGLVQAGVGEITVPRGLPTDTVISAARDELWLAGGPPIRQIMSVDSIGLGSARWSWLTDAIARDNITSFPEPSSLALSAERTSDGLLVTQALGAVASQYRKIFDGSLPSEFAKWALPVGNIKGSDTDGIVEALRGIRFSDRHTDSGDDWYDAHPVSLHLREGVDNRIRMALLEAAMADAETTNNKPGVWKRRLDLTLYDLAARPTDDLRFFARDKLGLPQDDEDYKMLILEKQAIENEKEREKQERRLKEHKIRVSQRERVLEQVRLRVTSIFDGLDQSTATE